MTRPTIAALVASALLGAATANAASLFDPSLRFRQLRTEHFVIYFHQGEGRLAQRLGSVAEETWHLLRPRVSLSPPALTRVILADQTELWNGYATPLPRDTIVIYPVWPSGSELPFDDWLRIAFTHEFTHIVHLDRSEGWARIPRAILGRTAYAFPNWFLPAWQIEGLATYEESVITGEGRLHAGDFLAIVGEGAARKRFEPLDRVNGGLTDWPGGAAVYAYGVGFHAYLADRFGAQTLATLADRTARSLPYTGTRAFKTVYGQPLGTLWREYRGSGFGRNLSTDRRCRCDPPDPSRILRARTAVRSLRVSRLPSRDRLLRERCGRLSGTLSRIGRRHVTSASGKSVPGIHNRGRS